MFCRGTKMQNARASRFLTNYLEPIVQDCTQAALATQRIAKKNRWIVNRFSSCENIISRSQTFFLSHRPPPPPPPSPISDHCQYSQEVKLPRYHASIHQYPRKEMASTVTWNSIDRHKWHPLFTKEKITSATISKGKIAVFATFFVECGHKRGIPFMRSLHITYSRGLAQWKAKIVHDRMQL